MGKCIENSPTARCLSTGYSCRSQVKRIDNIELKHPLQALLRLCNDMETKTTLGQLNHISPNNIWWGTLV